MSTVDSLKKLVAELPETPGVYFFRGDKNQILYIGRATSLKDRVKSYFSKNIFEMRGPLIEKMVSEARHITVTETESVLEAILLEANLIKKYQPEFNTRDKDNKSWVHVIITNEDFPRVLLERSRTLPETYSDEDIKYNFGPFSSGADLRRALKIIRKIFPYRDDCVPYEYLDESKKESARPCFNAQIGLCPGVCVGATSRKEYAKIIRNIKLFFEGKKLSVIKLLEKEMSDYSKKEEFEKAGEVKETLFALKQINDVALRKNISQKSHDTETRIEAYDVSHFGGNEVVGVMVVVEGGEAQKSEYRKFKIKGTSSGDTIALEEMIERRLRHDEWRYPDIVVTDGGDAQLNVARRVFGASKMVKTPQFVSVVKDERHKPREILGENPTLINDHKNEILLANAEAHRFAIAFQKLRRGKTFIHKKK